jgi:hypothetical protein
MLFSGRLGFGGREGMQVLDGTCDTGVTKLGAMRADRRHWRAAEKFLAASIVNRSRQSAVLRGRCDGGEEEERREKGRKNRLSRRRTDPTGQTALVV